MLPGNLALFPQINRILGYDIEPHLADLWYSDSPDSMRHRADYHRAIGLCLEENYYRRLSRWCARHRVALTGHPGGSMDIGAERYFQIPGQDLVWRYVLPGKTALEGEHSTTAKCASSAMIHLKRRRNSNELYGAYGHDLTFDEMQWLAGWALVRGHNLLYPHAFYYSVRGPRQDERPPDVGPNAAWWEQYKPYADYCRRLRWLNTDSRHERSGDPGRRRPAAGPVGQGMLPASTRLQLPGIQASVGRGEDRERRPSYRRDDLSCRYPRWTDQAPGTSDARPEEIGRTGATDSLEEFRTRRSRCGIRYPPLCPKNWWPPSVR